MPDSKRAAKAIAREEVRRIVESREDVTLVDIRNHSAYKRSHIPGAEPFPFGASEPEAYPRRFPNKKKPLIIYDYKGDVAKIVADALIEQGYEDVSFMEGGHWAWRFMKGAKPKAKGAYPDRER